MDQRGPFIADQVMPRHLLETRKCGAQVQVTAGNNPGDLF
jgi:hypothetical protein